MSATTFPGEVSRESYVDKSAWPRSGEWNDEPDRVEWRARGFAALIVRGPSGALCGYVGVEPGHPWHGVPYERVDAEAHGGLTYSNHCAGEICHVPQPGEGDAVWWLGFDCAHCYDLMPAFDTHRHSEYRSLAYVRREVEKLARQAHDAAVAK